MQILFLYTRIFIITALFLFTAPTFNSNAKNFTLIRDSEIESTITSYATPIFLTAGLNANTVNIYIVNDSRINAFVSNGLNLYLNTGLLIAGDDPGPLMAVIAHEAGHLAAGHLVRTRKAITNASSKALLGSILGATTALVAGNPQAAGAVTVAGSALAQTSLMRYSMAQEQAADQAAIKYLNELKIPLEGMLEVLKTLKHNEIFLKIQEGEYISSHPLTRDRIRFVRNQIKMSQISPNSFDAKQHITFERMQSKLYAFLHTPEQTLIRYPESDQSLAARYARAIAYFRIPTLQKAINTIDSLLEEQPNDPWFHELKGQMLFENGRVSSALLPLKIAASLRPQDALLRLLLARAQLENNSQSNIQKAIDNLHTATQFEPNYAPHWYFLGIAYGRNNEFPKSKLALAEASLLRGDLEEAIYLAEKAKRNLIIGSPSHIRASDISNSAANQLNR